jgi:hypothetical protein
MVQCAKFAGKPIEECTRTWNCPCSTEKPQPKQSASGWPPSPGSGVLFAETRDVGMFRVRFTISLWGPAALDIEQRLAYAIRATIKEHQEALERSADTPTKQHLKPDTAPKNSSSS